MEATVEELIEGAPKEEIEMLVLDSWKGESLSLSEKALIESFPNIEFLTFNSSGLHSLTNFPCCPNLIKVELNNNSISGGLDSLLSNSSIMQISLENNQISDFEELKPLQGFKELLNLDLKGNPISEIEGYPSKVFKVLPKLRGVDGLDQEGEVLSDFASANEDEDEEDIEDLDELEDLDDIEPDDGDEDSFEDDEEDDEEEELGKRKRPEGETDKPAKKHKN